MSTVRVIRLPYSRRRMVGAALLLALVAALLTSAPARDASAQEVQPHPRNAEASATGGVTAEAVAAAIIDNGVIQLGIHPEGHLNVPGTVASTSGTTTVGLRYLHEKGVTEAEATAPGCTCEGWGAGIVFPAGTFGVDGPTTVSGSANDAISVENITVESFEVTGSTATSVVRISGTPHHFTEYGGANGDEGGGGSAVADAAPIDALRVTHVYRPAAATPNLYQVEVTVENISGMAGEVRYRRVMDWDIDPTPFSEYVTIDGSSPPPANLLYSSNDGFSTADPVAYRSDLGSVGPPFGTYFTDVGPSDHGALFDFGFGTVGSGASTTFSTYYGAATSHSGAVSAISAVGAEVWSFGKPSTEGNPATGEPNTFIFGFGSVGGESFVDSDDRPPVFLRVFGDRTVGYEEGALAPNPAEFVAELRNVGTAPATGGELQVTVDPALTLRSPAASTTPVADIAGGTSVNVPISIGVPEACEATSYEVSVTYTYDQLAPDEAPRNATFDIEVEGSCGVLTGIVRHVTGASEDPVLPGATVSLCSSTGTCTTATADDAGAYRLAAAPGTYRITVRPPATHRTLLPRTIAGSTLTRAGGELDVTLAPLRPPPGSVGLTGGRSSGGLPILSRTAPDILTYAGCPGGDVTFSVTAGGSTGAPITMTETGPGPDGTSLYEGSVPTPSLPPGYGSISIDETCPEEVSGTSVDAAATTTSTVFDIFVEDPSRVRDENGAPLQGAQVVLEHRVAGSWSAVPDGDPILGVLNTTNPDVTDADGRFGWDPAAGEYRVVFSKEGCETPAGAATGVSTAFVVPPDAPTLDLRLDCSADGSLGPAQLARWAGQDRAETAAIISQQTFDRGVGVAFITTQGDFPDALTGGPLAANLGGPILLVSRDGIPTATARELTRLAPRSLIVLGGDSVVSDELVAFMQRYTTGSVRRLAGTNRYGTAAAVAAEHEGTGGVVYVASGAGYADALTGGAAAARDDAPMLLVEPDGVPAETAAALRRLDPSQIVLLGGVEAVTARVAEALQGFGAPVERIGGDNRYETSAMIAAPFAARGDRVFIATGRNYPDALAGIVPAGRSGAPLLLADGSPLPSMVAGQLLRLEAKEAVVLGGPVAVPEETAKAVLTAMR